MNMKIKLTILTLIFASSLAFAVDLKNGMTAASAEFLKTNGLPQTSIAGKTDASNPGAGLVGETITSVIAPGSAVTLETATTNVTSISLTAGDWNVTGNVNYTFGGVGATYLVLQAASTTNSLTIPTDGTKSVGGELLAEQPGEKTVICVPRRVNVPATTTVYLVAASTIAAGTTITVHGSITAIRK